MKWQVNVTFNIVSVNMEQTNFILETNVYIQVENWIFPNDEIDISPNGIFKLALHYDKIQMYLWINSFSQLIKIIHHNNQLILNKHSIIEINTD